jgi:enterochelin esterase-like enzyme
MQEPSKSQATSQARAKQALQQVPLSNAKSNEPSSSTSARATRQARVTSQAHQQVQEQRAKHKKAHFRGKKVHYISSNRNGTIDRVLDTKHGVFVILRTIRALAPRPYFILIQTSFFRKNQRYRNSSLLFPYF